MAQVLRVDLEQIGSTTATAAARSHRVFVDRPAAKGGEDRGPLGGEYLLVALGGCFMSNLLAAIRARDASVSDVRVSVSAVMDGSPERFTAFTVDVSAGAGDPDLVRRLIGVAARACAVTNTLRRSAPVALALSGSPVEVLE